MPNSTSGGPSSRVAIVIPARYASSRFPGKPLQPVRDKDGTAKPLIQHSYEAAKRVAGVLRVAVATDDSRIADVVYGFGGDVLMTPESCANGTERVAACLDQLPDADLLINFQGDALLTPPDAVSQMIAACLSDTTINAATVATPCSANTYRHLAEDAAAGRVGGTTVVVNMLGDALYFSKRLIPYLPADVRGAPPVLLHLGLYAYRRAALAAYVAANQTDLEKLEGLEQLRFLVHAMPMRVVTVPAPAWEMVEVNNPQDVPIVDAIIERRARGATT